MQFFLSCCLLLATLLILIGALIPIETIRLKTRMMKYRRQVRSVGGEDGISRSEEHT